MSEPLLADFSGRGREDAYENLNILPLIKELGDVTMIGGVPKMAKCLHNYGQRWVIGKYFNVSEKAVNMAHL